MNWEHFQTYNEAPTRAFEAFCNQLFEQYCKREFKEGIKHFAVVNGSGGDGGVEAYAILNNNDIIGLQAKWFTDSITDNQFLQIKNSIETAIKIRPAIKKYIVCIPRDLGSLKIGRGEKVIKNPEDERWRKLKQTNPDIELILWDESELLNQLQNPECSSIQRYWFEKSELDINNLKYAINIQKEGWLKLKYIPDLHSKGTIDNNIKKFIGTVESKIFEIKKLNLIKYSYTNFLALIDDYKKFGKFSEQIENSLNPIEGLVNFNISRLNQLINDLINDSFNTNSKYDIKTIDFGDFLDEFYNINSESSIYSNKFDNAIGSIKNNNHFQIIKEIQEYLTNNLLLFIGNPGTGKTHGIVNVVEDLLEDGNNAAILIQAKSVSPNEHWKDILIRNLELSNNWAGEEIWQALESLSHRLECKQALEQKDEQQPYMIPKILVCIDGLDELRPFDFWIEKLRETKAISSKYPRIKFCVTSRPCTFQELKRDDEILQNKINLGSDGDVPVNKLFNDYIQKYNITITDCNWVKWSLKTPLALRLFCEIYTGQTITNISSSSITISKLIEQKIQIMDTEFRKFCNNYTENDYILKKSISVIGEYFLTNNEILKDDLLALLKESTELKFVCENNYIKIIEYLENYGFLQTYIYKSSELLAIPQTFYESGIQPFFDYILAIILFNKNPNPKDIISIKALKNNFGALQMFSILLMEHHNLLVSEIECFKKELLPFELSELVYFAITNVSMEQVNNYVPQIKKFMDKDATCLMEIVNEIILPVSRINSHPLGTKLLHEYLMLFDTPAKRDLMWSIQFWLSSTGDEIWSCADSINLDSYEIIEEDSFEGLPLLYAWLLTNIDNTKRALYRKELMKWALMRPDEYCKLFNLAWQTNDPQMKEDLLGIAMGLVLSVNFESETLKVFSDFVINEIFTPQKIHSINNIAIRHYARAIAERAYQANLISKEQLNSCIPPFQATSGKIRMEKDAAMRGHRMSGYNPITYDLARYVLCDTIEHTFFDKRTSYENNDKEPVYSHYFKKEEIDKILKEYPNLKDEYKIQLRITKDYLLKRELPWQQMGAYFDDDSDNKNLETIALKKLKKEKNDDYSFYNEDAKNFLIARAKEIGVKNLRPDQFVLSAAYAYIKNLGWENEFNGNGGIDSTIKSHYSPLTHGSQSKIMTLCEKYIWCFKNEIYGYLMDRLEPKNDYDIDGINDYSLITTSLINPIQELYQKDPKETMANTAWYAPELLSPPIKGLEATKNGIKNWIKNAPIPDFSRWINIINYEGFENYDNNWIVLDSFNKIDEPNVGAESILWVSSGIIEKDKFNHLISDLEQKRSYISHKLANPTDFTSSTITDCYITPKEICQMEWKQETSSIVEPYTIVDNEIISYQILKAVEKCVSGYAEHGEIYYELPSKGIRKILDIVDGDGSFYYDENKNIQSICFEAGEAWKEQQSVLCANNDKLIANLEAKKQKMFWLCRLLREPSIKAHKKLGDFYVRSDRTWMVWFENDECKSLCFHEDNHFKS